MRTTFEIKGFNELVLNKAVNLGIARSRTDAIKIGIFALNEKFNLIKDVESELMVDRLKLVEKDMVKKGTKYLSDKEVTNKYKHLL